jgi:prepilin-type N-terminal cleavage/methylation domain-containing protein
MKIRKFLSAFTLIELLVVISIIAILAGIALPVFSQVQIKGAQTKALSNAKQVALALKVYATDNSGNFPVGDTSAAGHSNTAFAQLFPQYLTNETIFWLAKSPECSATPPDNVIDPAGTSPPQQTLSTTNKENHWAYVNQLTDTSNSSFPLIADAFASVSTHKYTSAAGAEGSVWSGLKAIVIRVDCSGAIEKCSTDFSVPSGPGATDLFGTTGSTWLATSNNILNP